MSKVIIVQVGWTAESNKSWIAADGGTEDRPGTALNISENTSVQNRSGKVTYTQAESGNRVVVNVNQEGEEAPAPKYTYTIRTNEPDVEFLVYKGEEGGEDFVEIERVTASMVVGGKYVATFETEEEDGRYRVKPLKSVVDIDIVDFDFSGSTNTSFTKTVSSSTASFDLRPNDSHTKQAIISTTGWSSTSQVFNASREVEIESITSNRVWGEGAVVPIFSAECFQAEDEEVPECCTSSEETHIDRYDVWGKFSIGVPTTTIAGKVFAKNGKFTADIVYKNTDAFKYVVSTHLLLDVNVFVQDSGSSESTKWYWAFRITKPSGVTATSVPHVVVKNESDVEVFNKQRVRIGERIQVGEITVPSGEQTPGQYTITIDGFEESVINTSESTVDFENGVSDITLNDSTTPPTFTVVRKDYTPATVKTITVSADCKMVGNVNGEIQPSTDENAATDIPLDVALCNEWKAEVTNATDKDWLSISKDGNNLVLNFIRENDKDNERKWDDKIIEITCGCNSGTDFETAKYVTVSRESIPYDGEFFVSGRSDFYVENVLMPEENYADIRQRYLFTPIYSAPFGFMSGTSTATTLIPAVTYLDDLKIHPNVVFSDAGTPMSDYNYAEKYDELHMYDVVYYKGGVLYHSIEMLTGNTITDNPVSAWDNLNALIGSGGTGLTFTVSTGNGTVNMVMGGFSPSNSISSDIFNGGGVGTINGTGLVSSTDTRAGGNGGTIRSGAFNTRNYAKCFNVTYEIGGIAGGMWPEWFVPKFLRTSDYDVTVNDPHFSSDGTGIVEIVTIDGVEYYLIHDYSKVTVTPKDNNGEG
jgi:hypothetical protein